MMSDTVLRLFFAIELDSATRAAVAQLMQELRGQLWGRHIRWTQPESLHITLRFIGNCPEDKISNLLQQVQTAIQEVPPFSLKLAGIRLFPSATKPHVIAVSIEPNAMLFDLERILEQGVLQAGFSAETRAYLPHVTLGRFTRRSVPDLPTTMDLASNKVGVDRIVLLRSDRTDGRQIYTPLQTLALTGLVQPKVAVGAVVIKDGKILLVKRRYAPNQGRWAIPGGKVHTGETLQETAEREIAEETSVTIKAREIVDVFDLIDRNENGVVCFHYVIIDVAADYIRGTPKASSDALEAAWVDLKMVTQLDLTASTLRLLQKVS